MAKKKKKMPGLNTSSTADISFMLLIFFLVTTSMDSDKGLVRHLPKPPETQEKTSIQINEKNILQIDINSRGDIRVCGSTMLRNEKADLAKLRAMAKDFILGNPHEGSSEAPDFTVQNLETFGRPVKCFDKHVISLQADRGTPYEVYFVVQNELVAAYNELRDQKCKEQFHHTYNMCTDEQKADIRKLYPQNISEAEPRQGVYGN